MLWDDTVADHVQPDVDPPSCREPPRGSWPRPPVANPSGSTDGGASSTATLTLGGTLDSQLGWRRYSRLAWLVRSGDLSPFALLTVPVRLLAVTLLAVQVLVGLLGYLQIGIVGHFGRKGHIPDAHCREITVSEPWKWSFPDSERAFLPSPCLPFRFWLGYLVTSKLGLLLHSGGGSLFSLLTVPARLLTSPSVSPPFELGRLSVARLG